MPPWVIIALLMGAGLVLLIIAPRLHRRSIARSRDALADRRRQRLGELRGSGEHVEIPVPTTTVAAKARDSLLLVGVRTEIGRSDDGVVLLGSAADADLIHREVARFSI